MTSFPSSINHIQGDWVGPSRWNISTNQNLTDNSIKHYDLYDVPSNSTYPNNGIQFVLNGSATEVHVEGTGDLGVPTSVAIGNVYNSQTTVTIADGDTVSFWASPTSRYFSMVVTSSMLFSGGGTSTEEILFPSGSVAKGYQTLSFTVNKSSPLTSSVNLYRIFKDYTFLRTINHSSSTEDAVSIEPNPGSGVWRLWHDDTANLTLLGSYTIGSNKKVSCNFW